MEELNYDDEEEEEEFNLDEELKRATENGNLERVKQHIEAGADVNYIKVN